MSHEEKGTVVAPKGWTSIHEDLRRGGLVYVYPDGSEFHMTRDQVHQAVKPGQPEV